MHGRKRVVVTGLGVVSPNAIGLREFEESLRNGVSGVEFHSDLEKYGFGCLVAGVPKLPDILIYNYLPELTVRILKNTAMKFGCIAAVDAWKDAGFECDPGSYCDWESGCVFGSSSAGIEVLRNSYDMVDQGNTRKLGTRIVEQIMSSGVSAYIGGLLGLGNQITSNSSACCTGTESVIMAYDRIRYGQAKRMVAGSCEGISPYIWAGFDSMRVLCRNSNSNPHGASRPMSATASGFVPGAGAGAMVLEDFESATARGAKIYAELIGASINSGGQRNGGTMTASNSMASKKCIADALKISDTVGSQIDLISGHLTATSKDSIEIENWSQALNCKDGFFPFINSVKSMTGHCLGASGSIECVATVLQLYNNFIHPSTNCEDIHPQILKVISSDRIPDRTINKELNIVAKASFGFGDVNSCLIFKRI